MVSAIDRVESMPKAAKLIPYMFARVNDTNIVIAKLNTGIIVELYPRANPAIMLGAAPVAQALANF